MSLSQEYGQISVYFEWVPTTTQGVLDQYTDKPIQPFRKTAICDGFNEESLREEPRGWFYNCNRKIKRHDALTQLGRIVCQLELLVVLRIIFGELRRGEEALYAVMMVC
jgi:hypothetical protein